MPNQHKPLPPEEEIRKQLEFYYHLNLKDTEIAIHMKHHYDTNIYGLSVASIKRLRKKWGLQSTRQQGHTLNSIATAISEIRRTFPSRGAATITKELRLSYNIRVSRRIVSEYLQQTEPDAVNARKHRRFKRRQFYAAGVNDVWGMDQHDKWGPRFGLWLHNGIDPFINSFNLWLKVWWTNKNPRLIGSYYIERVRKDGAIPLVTQSDPGSENYTVANIQTAMRHRLDPSLRSTLQHRWKRKKANIKNEANWSVFRRDFAPGYEDMFESGVNQGWYDVHNALENLVFRWIAIPWVQSELDRWVILRNRTAPRANTKKILPQGIPELMREHPETFNLADFKIGVTVELIDEMEAEYIQPGHPVFELTPPAFHIRAANFYDDMGQPAVTFDSFWTVYRELLGRFRDDQTTVQRLGQEYPLDNLLQAHFSVLEDIENEEIPLPHGLAELREGGNVIGTGMGAGEIAEPEYADFTPSESESSEDSDSESHNSYDN